MAGDGRVHHLFEKVVLSSLPIWVLAAEVRDIIDERRMLVDLLWQTALVETSVGGRVIFRHSRSPASIVAALARIPVTSTAVDGSSSAVISAVRSPAAVAKVCQLAGGGPEMAYSFADKEDGFRLLSAEERSTLRAYLLGCRPRDEVVPPEVAAGVRAKLGLDIMAAAFVPAAFQAAIGGGMAAAAAAPDRAGVVRAVARMHNALVHMHPLIDGNGRAARALGNWLLMTRGVPPVLSGSNAYYGAVQADMSDPATRNNDPGPPKVATAAVAGLMMQALQVLEHDRMCWGCGAPGAGACPDCGTAHFCTDCKKQGCGAAHKAWCDGLKCGVAAK
ncbi:hypothetical protein HXX76_016246 [Chlamydomonas incerta]|uniref:Fido domain-containing protein n=1 Tax=Chlamydomonas incerta TaxID=51695 RepID=A0A835SEY0_CHLIN|nr:hypothetical protein HXX76_016246 [Chlamydomonas incerta]|eukprot:KAG2422148.1 hypothetical protein HXX76_016246 [Chlamydomonas incerta]